MTEQVFFAVSPYQDVIKQKRKREFFCGKPIYEYFSTDEEARAFIRQRADAECAKAEKALERAIARTKKCQKKFGFVLRLDAAWDRSTSSSQEPGK